MNKKIIIKNCEECSYLRKEFCINHYPIPKGSLMPQTIRCKKKIPKWCSLRDDKE